MRHGKFLLTDDLSTCDTDNNNNNWGKCNKYTLSRVKYQVYDINSPERSVQKIMRNGYLLVNAEIILGK